MAIIASVRSPSTVGTEMKYESARVSPKDSCSRLAKTYTGLDHLDAMFADWLRYRCWRSKQRLMYLVDDNPDSLQAKDSLESLQHQLTFELGH